MVKAFEPFVPVDDTDIATFDDGSADAALVKLDAAITPVQAGSGTPAPDNVRAITGFTGADAHVSGSNAWDEESELGTFGGGAFVPSTTRIRNKNAIPVKPGVQYYLKTSSVTYVMAVDAATDWTRYQTFSDASGSFVLTVPEWAHFIYISPDNAYGAVYKNDISVNYPSTDTEYHAYAGGDTYPIDWTDDAGTVYGGSINFTTGELIVTHAAVKLENMTAADMSQFYTGSAFNNIEFSNMRSLGAPDADYISDQFATVQALTAPYQIVKGTSPTATRCYLSVPTDYATKEAAIELINTLKPTIVYELATPLTYELTPVEVKTLEEKGTNNVWVSTGKIIELYYPIDIDFIRRHFMVNSGYILLDGGDIDLTETDPQLIVGSWDRIVTAMETGKPIWAFNTKYGTGKPLSPVPVFAWYLSNTSIVIVGATLHIIVSNNDYCVVQDVAA